MIGSSDKYYALGGQIIRALGRVVVGALAARVLGPEAYAPFVLLVAIEIMLLSLLAAYCASPMQSMIPAAPEDRRPPLLRIAIRKQIKLGVIMAAGTVLTCVLLLGYDWFLSTAFGLALVAGAAFQATRAGAMSTFRARITLFGEVAGVIIPVAMALGAHAIGLDPLPALWLGIAVAGGVGASMGLRRLPRSDAVATREERRDLHRLGLVMGYGSVAYSLGSRLHPMIVAAVLTAIDLAMFGVVLALSGPPRLFSAALTSVAHPRLAAAAGDPARARRLAFLIMAISSGGAAIMTIASIPLADLGIWLVYGDEYAAAAPLLPWAVAYAGIASVGSLYTVILQTSSRANVASRARVVASAIGLASALPLMQAAGSTGAFVSLILGEVAFIAYAALPAARVSSTQPASPALGSP